MEGPKVLAIQDVQLEPRHDFPAFPYPPYDIQLDFMQHLYRLLCKGGVGFFESPTGTGKTMSLICGTLQWLHDWHEAAAQQAKDKLNNIGAGTKGGGDDDDTPDWLQQAFHEKDVAAIVAAAPKPLGKPAETTQTTKRIRKKAAAGGSSASVPSGTDELAEFVLEDVEKAAATSQFSSSSDSDPSEAAYEEPPRKRPQVIFCSRTHSQLSQFIGELHRTPFGDTMSVVALASRKVLCVHDPVLRLCSSHRINEACLNLQTQRSSKRATAQSTAHSTADKPSKGRTRRKKGRCPYLSVPRASVSTFQELVLTQPMDIEELVKNGRRRVVCPYYAVRAASPQADIVVAPYSALIHGDTRKSLGVEVEGSVIIFDEGHNLVDAVNGANSASVSGHQLAAAQGQIEAYFMRFRGLLAPANAKQIQVLLKVLKQLSAAIQPTSDSEPHKCVTRVTTFSEFLISHQLDGVNLFQVLNWVRESKLVMKVSGYAGKEAAGRVDATQSATQSATPTSASPHQQDSADNLAALHAVVGFVSSLTSTDADGRVVICGPSKDNPSGSLRMVLLDAGSRFSQAVKGAHAVVLASGTLSPVTALAQQLFPDLGPGKLVHFACGHVVPPEQLVVLSVGKGPGDVQLDLRQQGRSNPAVMNEIGVLLQNLCRITPGGLIVFAPSNSFLDQLYQHWQTTGQLAKFQALKKVFREPSTSQGVDPILTQFSAACEDTGEGIPEGMLLAVVGGKLAEGINFGDSLGRCVVMLGLPYPNPTDVELKARMSYLDAVAKQDSASSRLTGSAYYDNLCFKAVNQCIGRVIRHQKDYAAIVLVDARYTIPISSGRSSPLSKLPAWIQKSVLQTNGKFGPTFSQLQQFFRRMKTINDQPVVS